MSDVVLIILLVVLILLSLVDIYLNVRYNPRNYSAAAKSVKDMVDARVEEAHAREMQGPGHEERTRSNRQLSEPPMLDGMTLKSWLIYHSKDEGVWSKVVTEFYERAADEPTIREYFDDVIDRGGFEALQKHFLGALMIVTNSGVTEGTVRAMEQAHLGVVNADRQPINSVVYDAVINTLVAILGEVGVPQLGITQLSATIAPLRAAIVRS